MADPDPSLGTILRHLIERLDGDVQEIYRRRGLASRSRYTPVFRVLAARGPQSIRQIAESGLLTHSAASQTVARMTRDGLVTARAGTDGRERIIALSPEGERLLPEIQACWAAFALAVDDLSAEIGVRLDEVAIRAIAALDRRSFTDRIEQGFDPIG